jgi:hypothetical protein
MINRALQPKILETKEELLIALKSGQLKTSKYNLLSPNEKLFVELVVFGGYTGEQAVRCISPTVHSPQAIANRMLANPNVADTLEELSIQKDKKFMAEISSARDMALSKLKYIMSTTSDQALAASCAKVILDKSEAIMKNHDKKEEQVGGVRFNIQVENVYTGSATPSSPEPVIIPIDLEEEDNLISEREKLKNALDGEIQAKKAKVRALDKKLNNTTVNPNTGLPYVIAYEGVDNYTEVASDAEVNAFNNTEPSINTTNTESNGEEEWD